MAKEGIFIDMTVSQKDCFGVLENVFPMGEKGLREIVPDCFDCPHRISCLQAALDTKEGLEFRGEIIDRSTADGLIGRIKRWSDKKELSRLIRTLKQREGKKK